MGFLLEELIMT